MIYLAVKSEQVSIRSVPDRTEPVVCQGLRLKLLRQLGSHLEHNSDTLLRERFEGSYLQDSVAQRFCPARVSSQLETLIAVAEHLEEGLHLGEQVVVVGRKDDVGDVPGWRPRLHRQAVPVVEAQWTHGHPFPLIADCDTGYGKRFAAIVSVALGGDPGHPVELPPGQGTLHGHLRSLLAGANVQRDLEDRQQALHHTDDVLAAAGTRAGKHHPLVKTTCSSARLQVALAIRRGRRSDGLEGAPHRVGAVQLLDVRDRWLLRRDGAQVLLAVGDQR